MALDYICSLAAVLCDLDRSTINLRQPMMKSKATDPVRFEYAPVMLVLRELDDYSI
jgi:hypothetical protein